MNEETPNKSEKSKSDPRRASFRFQSEEIKPLYENLASVDKRSLNEIVEMALEFAYPHVCKIVEKRQKASFLLPVGV